MSSAAVAGGRWIDRSNAVLFPGIVEIDLAAAGRAVAVGSGCSGSNGVPTLSAVNGVPVPASSFTLLLAQLPQTPTTSWLAFGLPLGAPLDLGQFGMPNCTWRTNQFYFTFVNSTGATATSTFPVISNPALRGVHIHTQAAVFDPPANALGATVSNALSMVYGVGAGEVVMTERFLDASMLDRERSGGGWAGGQATFAAIGGDGVLGTFDHTLGTSLGVIAGLDTYEFDTTSTLIPASNTLTGVPILVTDGRFAFDTMVVPAGVRVRFTGSAPARITVAGHLDIQGEIDVQGESLGYLAPTSLVGQPGGRGGVFGGRGGKGGDKILGATGTQPTNQGQDGESAHVLAGHAYANTAATTGGRGSTVFPASGLNSALIFSVGAVTYPPSASAGGGGGGLWTAGAPGVVLGNNHVDPITNLPPLQAAMGPAAPGGTALQFFPFPPTSGPQLSSLHFLAGGAGGGGAASNAALAINVAPSWAAGCGGGGGGGALALRAGDAIDLATSAAVRANGGTAANALAGGTSYPAPGGGGSGGTIVLQSGRVVSLTGTIDVRGGLGGSYNRTAGPPAPIGASVQIAGGNGGDGFVRLELPGTPTTALLPNMLPAPVAQNVAALAERDDIASATSRFADTRLSPGPRYLRYEIAAVVDGVPMLFSDDPAVSTLPATTGMPLRAWFQAARLGANGQVLETRAWRTAVRSQVGVAGIDGDGLGAFRFRIAQDRTLATTVVVQRVSVVFDAAH
ncbi:MAG: hypothetical protein U1E73_11220 [Planctomycetota bacterium]